MLLGFDRIAKLLDLHKPGELPADDRTRAAVAMVLRQGRHGMEMLFIERATHERDPWSGNLAFPGGKVEPGEEPRQAAERETVEEIGLELGSARYLGRLADIAGAHLRVRVTCFVYGMQANRFEPVLNYEVKDLFWVGLDDLMAAGRRVTAPVSFDDQEFDVPAIRLPQPGKPVLWGLTYRLTMQFLEIVAES
ncbi:MAG: CoA pyrophosphatase [Deltaproteobacteria bacterium]|nr:CoA pyrophosphatase [Deltaproteobacteria bacterium]